MRWLLIIAAVYAFNFWSARLYVRPAPPRHWRRAGLSMTVVNGQVVYRPPHRTGVAYFMTYKKTGAVMMNSPSPPGEG